MTGRSYTNIVKKLTELTPEQCIGCPYPERLARELGRKVLFLELPDDEAAASFENDLGLCVYGYNPEDPAEPGDKSTSKEAYGCTRFG